MAKNHIPFVGIIVLEYNNYLDTHQCIRSIKKSDYQNYHIFLVDNASEISIYNKLVKQYENDNKVTTIRTSRNGGYGAGNNWGIRFANKHNPDYYLIVNNDTIVESDMITKLVKHIEKDKKIGIVFPNVMFLIDNEKSNIINSAGGNFSKFGFANDKFFGLNLNDIKDKIDNNFFFAPGVCFLIRRATFEEIKGFDENIFMYWDDVDFSWRTRLFGFDIQIVPESLIYHKLSISSGRKKNAFKVYNREFSWLYVIIKNMSLKNIIKFLPVYIIFMFVKIIFNMKNKEHFRAIIAAYLKFFGALKENIKQHKGVQQRRKIDDQDILSLSNHGAMKQSIFYRDQG